MSWFNPGPEDIPRHDWLDHQPLNVHTSEIEYVDQYKQCGVEWLPQTEDRTHSRH